MSARMPAATPTRAEHATSRVHGSVPAATPRIVLAVVAAVLCATQLTFGLWFVVAVILAVLSLIVPRLLTAWAFVLVVGLSMLFREPSVTDWRPYLLLAGVHLVHLYAAQCVVTPVRGRVQLRVLLRPLRAFLIVQVPSQFVLALVLWLHRPDAVGWSGNAVPLLAAVGALALVVLTLLFAITMRAVQR